jgi:hypothetical protein
MIQKRISQRKLTYNGQVYTVPGPIETYDDGNHGYTLSGIWDINANSDSNKYITYCVCDYCKSNILLSEGTKCTQCGAPLNLHDMRYGSAKRESFC